MISYHFNTPICFFPELQWKPETEDDLPPGWHAHFILQDDIIFPLANFSGKSAESVEVGDIWQRHSYFDIFNSVTCINICIFLYAFILVYNERFLPKQLLSTASQQCVVILYSRATNIPVYCDEFGVYAISHNLTSTGPIAVRTD